MRLNDARIDSIATAIVDRLAEDEVVDLTLSEDDLANLIGDVIRKDLAIEEQIHAEAVAWLRQHRKHLVEGSDAWEIELHRQREQLAVRRGYVLP
jgi:hypothetical protein